MKLLSELMILLTRQIKGQYWTQKQAAERLGVTQPRISDLMRGKINLFRIDARIALLTAAGIRLELRVKDAA